MYPGLLQGSQASGEEIPLIPSPSLTTNSATPPATPILIDKDNANVKEPNIAKQRKRRTSLDPNKPRRVPPVPPTSVTTPKTPRTQPKPSSPSELKGVSKNLPPSREAAPVAPPRRKVKVKRVKRPATRLIPPPPSIPLPPPPTTRTLAPSPLTPASARSPHPPQQPVMTSPPVSEASREETQAAAVEAMGDPPAVVKETVETAKKTKKERESDDVQTSHQVAKAKPPPIKPKPAHLSKILSESSLPQTMPGRASPKPLPPTRSSSLLRPTRPRRRDPKPTAASVAEEEAVDTGTASPDPQETADAVRNLRSAPPTHPPPPRPDTTAEGESSRRRSNPPSFPPPQRPASTEPPPAAPSVQLSRSNSLKSRGSQLMRSLKKMVQRSEEGEESGVDGVKAGEVIQNLQTDSPAPQQQKEQLTASLPARPLPPKLPRQNSGSQKKATPSRPPPPRKQSSTASDTSKQELPLQPISGPTHNYTTTSSLPTGQSPVHSSGSSTSPSRSTSPQPPSTFYRARSEYTAQSASELTLHVGDILVEIDRPTPAMYYGMLDDGTTGLYPVSAVEPLVTPSNKK